MWALLLYTRYAWRPHGLTCLLTGPEVLSTSPERHVTCEKYARECAAGPASGDGTCVVLRITFVLKLWGLAYAPRFGMR